MRAIALARQVVERQADEPSSSTCTTKSSACSGRLGRRSDEQLTLCSKRRGTAPNLSRQPESLRLLAGGRGNSSTGTFCLRRICDANLYKVTHT